MQQNLETFEKTLNIARTIESVLIQGANVKGDLNEELPLLKIHKQNKQTTNNKFKLICFSCGSTGHPRAKCRLRNATCNICHKSGHIAKACRSKQFKNNNIINTIRTTSINTTSSTKSIQVKLLIDDIPVKLQLDTGSPITLVDEQLWIQMGCPALQSVHMNLNSFTGHPIKLKGQKVVNVKYKNQYFQLNLHFLAGVGNKILGLDWIHALHINSKSLNDIFSDGIMAQVNLQFKNSHDLLIHYNDIFKDGLGCCKLKAHLYVKPNVIPKFFKPRSLPFAYRQLVEMELIRLVNEGVLEPISISRWAAPIVVVPKPGGKVRICADLSTGVNQVLDIEQYPLPKPDELFTVLNGGEKFTKIDLSDAYLQVQLDDDSKELLVINTHKGLFRFNRLPFGIASAPSIFQKIMDQMIAGLDGTICYLDDIIVTGKNTIDHLNNLQQLFIRIREYGFHLNKQKCSFLQNQVEYLGYIVDKHGIHSSPSKTTAIIKMPRPGNISQLRSFLGMVNHYAKFIPKLTERLFPLYELLKMNKPWNWTYQCENAFKSIKEILISPMALVHYDPALPLVMAADASNVGVGAVIFHRYPNGSEKVIAHASKTLTPTEKKYSQIEKEALALIFGVQKFDQFLRGRRFTLLTDHKPLLTIFGSKKGIPTTSANRLQRWALRLMGYSYDIQYRSTHQFGQADGLSRLPAGPDTKFDQSDPTESRLINLIQQELQYALPLRAAQIAIETNKDKILSQVYNYILSGWPTTNIEHLQSYYRIRNELSTAHGCITWGFRTIIPTCFRKRLLNHLHSSHLGMAKMKAEARQYFWWPLLDKDIENIVNQCPSCSDNSKQPPKASLQQWNVPEQPWQRIHVDFMGKFFNYYYLIVVDAHSKWLEVLVMNNISTKATINALQLLFSRYGLCEQIVSDNGTQFTSEEFKQFCFSNGIEHIRTTPGHPQSNGQAERYVNTVKSAIKKGLYKGGQVTDVLNKFLFSYRTTPHATTNLSPAELFLKRKPRTVLDLLRPSATDISMKARNRYKLNFDRHTKDRQFNIGDKVLVRDFRDNPNQVKWTPGVLIGRIGSRIWSVQISDKIWRRHENQIKIRCYSTDDDVITIPTSSPPTTPTSNNSSSFSCKPNPVQGAQGPLILRRSSRKKRKTKRLIEET
ncbi:unnamed protein product [Rotaria sordida]|uniref:RNA-directed DNA polymerase n=1 Tax=Rotaria sordida TaxID=392033 RepID=A0A820A283_9BILA|nr:unnamed protein product [Rotaria sordida]